MPFGLLPRLTCWCTSIAAMGAGTDTIRKPLLWGGFHHFRARGTADDYPQLADHSVELAHREVEQLAGVAQQRFLACSIIHTVRDGFRIVAIRTRARAPLVEGTAGTGSSTSRLSE
jgi:hypothetical protein